MNEPVKTDTAIPQTVTVEQAVEGLLLLFNVIEDYAVFIVDRTGKIIVWHPCAERLLGYKAEEVMGQDFSCLYPPEDVAKGVPQQKLNDAELHGRADEEGWRIRKDGSRFWAFTSISAMHDKEGHVWAFGKIIRDLTERRKAETLFRSVIDNAENGIITSDVNGTILVFNRAAERIFEFSASEAVGQNVRLLMPEPDHSHHDAYIGNYLRTGQAKIIGRGREVVGRRKDGAIFPLQLEISEFVLDEHRHFIGIVRDVTANKQLQEQLRQSQKMEVIGQFSGGVAHDFNNLLTAICFTTEAVKALLPAQDPKQNLLDDIQDVVKRAASLTRQLLAFSRKQGLEPKVLNLNTIVSNTETLLRRLIGEDIILAIVLDSNISPIKVDRSQLEQVIANLALNARDAMPHGGHLTIETGSVDLAKENNPPECQQDEFVLLSVTDTGCGMSPDVKAHIFEPFFTTKEPGQGTGLGLATVYGIVKQSGGHVTVDSEPGCGATFRVYLPQFTERLPSEEPSPAVGPLPHGNETILLAEDEEIVRNSAENVLKSYGYTVLTACDGTEAMRWAGSHPGPIHLLISDVVMPTMGGRAVAEHITALRSEVKVLFVSGYTDDTVLRHGIVRGETAFLQKPFSPSQLLQKVRQVLNSGT